MDFDLTEEQLQLRDAARKLAQREFRERAARWDREETFPEENKHRLAELGYLGLSVDKEFRRLWCRAGQHLPGDPKSWARSMC